VPGYIFTLSGDNAFEVCATNGAYGTRMTRDAKNPQAQLMTLADYLTIKEGDLVFFFQERMIFGVGRVKKLRSKMNRVAALCNFPQSDALRTPTPVPEKLLWDQPAAVSEPGSTEEGEKDTRWVIFFEPHPHFMKLGLDMDEVLSSDKSGIVRQLPVFWKRSFIQIEDDEARVLTDLLFQKNREFLWEDIKEMFHPMVKVQDVRRSADEKATMGDYDFRPQRIVQKYIKRDGGRAGSLSQEAALQAWLVFGLQERTPALESVFGRFDVIMNQVPASPFKPPDWMDKMDIFGYQTDSFAEGFAPTITGFKIIEVKRETNQELARNGPSNPIDQTMKYVDWVAHHRAGGDYSLVKAYLITKEFVDVDRLYASENAKRNYVLPRRPYNSRKWNQLTLVSYVASGEGEITLKAEGVPDTHPQSTIDS
jgi:hypothetical protein